MRRLQRLARPSAHATSLLLAPGLQAAMESFDERGAGRRIAANLSVDEYGGHEDAGRDDGPDGGAYYGGGDDVQHGAAGAHQQQANAEEEEAPKVTCRAPLLHAPCLVAEPAHVLPCPMRAPTPSARCVHEQRSWN